MSMSETNPIRHVGFVGLGIMGGAMAANLITAGFGLTVWNRTRREGRLKPLLDAGAAVADSPADLASRGPEVICINVTDTPDVEAVLFGEHGIASTAAPGLIVIDHSTIDPLATQRFAQRLAEQGVILLDAPVSGGDVGAKNATLSIMVGGPADAFDRCRGVFDAVGKVVTHVGASGMGQVCKACNQIAVACTLVGTCEALALARAMGLDPMKMIEVVGGGAGASWQLANLGPKIVAGDFAPGFMIDLVLKDLRIISEAAEAAGVAIDGVRIAQRRFQTVQAKPGGGKLGTQAMAQACEPH